MSVLINEKDIIKNELAKMPADRDMFVEKFDRALGRVPDNKIKPMSIDKKQRHGKARTRFMDPTQRRKDGMVFWGIYSICIILYLYHFYQKM